MPFVRRDNAGNIVARYTVRQADELEWVADNAAELQPTMADLRRVRWETIKAARAAAIASGFVFGVYMLQSDPQSLANINGAVSGIVTAESLALTPEDVPWTMADNTVVTLTPMQVKQMGLIAMAHVQEQYAHAVALRAQIEAAQTPGELLAVVW